MVRLHYCARYLAGWLVGCQVVNWQSADSGQTGSIAPLSDNLPYPCDSLSNAVGLGCLEFFVHHSTSKKRD